MKFKKDITNRLKLDFNNSTDRVVEILTDAISKTDYLKKDRIIRCIIYLANGDIDQLKKFIDNAILEPRDVMLWAEYDNLDKSNLKRIRDFNHTFDQCTESVKK